MKDNLVFNNPQSKLFDIKYYSETETLNQKLHNHVYMQLIYIFSGIFSVHTETADFKLKKGELITLPPGNEISMENIQLPGMFCVISFDSRILKLITTIPHLDADLSYWFFNIEKSSTSVLKLNQKQIVKIEELLWDYQSAKNEKRNIACTSLMLELLTFISIFLKQSNLFSDGKSTRNILVNQAIAYIDNNFRNEISISVIADFLFINKKYLIHIFKQKVGITVKQYINQRRISFVKRMLSTYSMSPKEAFLHSGFNDYSAFFRAFKKATGDSPSNFKEIQSPDIKQEETKK